MQLKVKDLGITTGGNLIAILNEDDAKRLDLKALDRIKVTYRNKTETVMVNISESSKTINKGQVGLVEDVIKSLKVKDGNNVVVKIARKPLSLAHIKKKLDGYVLTKKEIDQIVWDIVHNKLSDIEITYFVSACYTKSMSQNETVLLTKAIVSNGEQLRLGRYPIADKHCIGGIPGNRTTMIIVPIIASAGFTIPKTSSRSITSPAGTADTMEVLADVSFSIKEMRRILKSVNGCIVWGGALNLAPADDKIINVERPLGIDAESQLIASIMAKKLSVNSTHIIIDIPTGENSKIEDICSAFCLKRRFEYIGRLLKRKIKVVITDGSEPIGNGIGPALEARDILYILMRSDKRPL
ncbi:MAG: thymidine phosphorylase, partial [Nanoarchaeota archaeon]